MQTKKLKNTILKTEFDILKTKFRKRNNLFDIENLKHIEYTLENKTDWVFETDDSRQGLSVGGFGKVQPQRQYTKKRRV